MTAEANRKRTFSEIHREDTATLAYVNHVSNMQIRDYILRFEPNFSYNEADQWVNGDQRPSMELESPQSGYTAYPEVFTMAEILETPKMAGYGGSMEPVYSSRESINTISRDVSFLDSGFSSSEWSSMSDAISPPETPVTTNREHDPELPLQPSKLAQQGNPAIPLTFVGPSDEELAALPIPEFLPNGTVRFVDRWEEKPEEAAKEKIEEAKKKKIDSDPAEKEADAEDDKEQQERESQLLVSRPCVQRLCRYYMSGSCKRGSFCSYFHPSYNNNNKSWNDGNGWRKNYVGGRCTRETHHHQKQHKKQWYTFEPHRSAM
ncbi:hypothetical protein L596_018242 [Steinernema carpocapsae]|uniref:C3H1-type domain-containing protein n=1 Tax=Steinernema carpocapsae TaxID=34508 RepID=A0A4U5N4F2_STECR|nr:hypothetical protein L596_018242 [Steinernema carpocapsae]